MDNKYFDYVSKILDEDEREIIILENKNSRVILKMKNGTGLFKIYPKMSYLNVKKFKIYKKCLEILKVNVVIISHKKMKFKKLNRILYCALCYIQNKKKVKSPKQIKKKSYFYLFIYKEIIIVFLLLLMIFIADYSTIKNKINKENQIKLNEIENLFKLNNCESKGHLQALKATCQEWRHTIELLKNVLYFYYI